MIKCLVLLGQLFLDVGLEILVKHLLRAAKSSRTKPSQPDNQFKYLQHDFTIS